MGAAAAHPAVGEADDGEAVLRCASNYLLRGMVYR